MKKPLEFLTKALAALLICCGLSISAFAQNRTISGTVVDSQNAPIIGASVMIVSNSNSPQGTVTDIDGKFSLNVPSGASLVVSFIGYKTETVEVGTQTVFNIVLQEDSEFLEETVVVGYGVQRKSDVTGAIASVKSSDLENRTTTDAIQAIQGKAAGVQIVNFSGAPGSESNIQIRGYSSNSSTRPLIIVDGLKVNSMNYLDPENIASMEILKDAASAAIYGVEAGNGVILITTKSGAAAKGTGRVFYNFQQTYQSVANLPDLMNAQEYMDYLMLAGAVKDKSQFDYDGVTDTYWPGLMFETGRMSRHTVGFQGGNDRGNVYVSLNSLTNDGIVTGDKDYNARLSAQINAEYKIKDWLSIGVNTSLTKTNRRSVTEAVSTGVSLFGTILTHDPITPWTYAADAVPDRVKAIEMQGYNLPRDAEGNLYGASVFGGNNLLWHPAIMRDRTDSETESFDVNGTAFVNLTPIKGLVITSRLGYRAGYSMQHSYSYELFVNSTESQAFSISATGRNSLYYQWENFANYTFNVQKNTFTAMAGMSFQKNTGDYITGSADQLTNYAPNYRYLSNAVNTSKMSLSGTPSESANMSYFGRIGWSYDNRYNLQANFRADAYDTSKLDPSSRWGFFPSVSAGWNITNESFMKNFKNTTGISMIKLRASWGINGNVNSLGSYQYATTLGTSVGNGYDFEDGAGMILGASPSTTLPNPNIKWETSHQVDIGLDVRAFKDRLNVALDWYDKNTHDLLTSITPPANTGATSVYVNAGKVNNRGFEFEASWKDSVGDFRYGISGNFATLKNKVVEGTGQSIPGAQRWAGINMTYFEEGYPLWYLKTFKVESIDQQTGAPIYKEIDGKEGITADDREYAGSGIPDLTYGLTLELGYKGFDLVVLGSGVQGIDKFFCLNRGDSFTQNTLTEFYTQAWQSPSSTGYKYPKPDAFDPNFASSDMRVFDASFFKIKQIQLGYSVPRNILKKIAMSNLRVYVSFDDWFTFTKYPGLDPETSAVGSGASSLGIDFGSYPMSKKIVFGVNVSF